MLQHEVPDPWILEGENSQGGVANILLGPFRKFAGGFWRTAWRPRPAGWRDGLLRHWPDHVLPDELVAVRGKEWQRGIVLKLERGNLVTVALRDWGRVIRRPVHDMYILENRFRELEWQAIPCGLAHIRHIGARSRWPRKAKELTRLLLEKREGWIRILGSIRDEAAIIALELKRARTRWGA